MSPRKTASSPRKVPVGQVSIGTVTLVLLILAAMYLLQELADQNAAPAPEAPPITAAGAGETGGWYELYFTDPTRTADLDTPSGGIPEKIIASLDEAQKTIDVAVYEFNLEPLAEALGRAKERGVRVRLVTDTDSLEDKGIPILKKAKIPVVEDQRRAIMHDKFIIIDGNIVWTGSMNFTRNDAYRNNNNFMKIRSSRLAENYTAEFEEMFSRNEFGPRSAADTPNPIININGVMVENYFAPEDEVATRILPLLKNAQSSIYFMAFAFTRDDFTDALIARAKAGVTVKGVFETRQIAAGADSSWKALSRAKLDVLQDGNKYNLHSKVFIIDQEIVVMGSYNFSKNADESNDENVLIIHDPTIAAAYYAEWQKVWAQAEAAQK